MWVPGAQVSNTEHLITALAMHGCTQSQELILIYSCCEGFFVGSHGGEQTYIAVDRKEASISL